MAEVLVSIVMPTYNYAQYLPEAIDSALAQNFSNFELIICDDASSDNSVEICQQYAKKDERILFVANTTNLGQAENLNYALSLAQGKYIKCLFADDTLMTSDALKRQIDILEHNPDITLVTSARTVINEHSQAVDHWGVLGSKDRSINGQTIKQRCASTAKNLIGEPSATLFRRSDIDKQFDTHYSQLIDLEMWFHLLEKGNLYYIAEPLCSFRKHAAQISAENRKKGVLYAEQYQLFTQHFSGFFLQTLLFSLLHRIAAKDSPDLTPLKDTLKSQFSFFNSAMYFLYTKTSKNLLALSIKIKGHY